MPTTSEAIALARKTPLTSGAIADLAEKLPGEVARAAAIQALDTAGANAAMALAFAAVTAGAKLPGELTRALLPEVSSLDHVGALVYATEGDVLELLTTFLGENHGDLELECFAMLLAAEELGSRPIPPVLLTRGRWLARHRLNHDAPIFLGGAVLRLKDRDLSSLATPHANKAKRSKKLIDEMLTVARSKPLDVLSEADGTRLSTGFTVRHETPSVGRNDPCPCGSGKKYKKCHALNQEPPTESEPPKVDARTLGPDQTALLRASEIAALDTTKLGMKAFIEAYRRVVDFRRWDVALRMIGEAEGRKDLEEHVTALVMDALRGAYEARALDAAVALQRHLPPELVAQEAFTLEVLRAPSDLLARIEEEAGEALRSEVEGARGMMLAAALLRWYPALGIFVARGALHEGRTLDSQALLETIEDARDRLLLSPYEPWWDVFEAFFDNSEERREQKKDDAKREKMKEDLKRARAASRKTAAEMEKLQQRVEELDELANAPVVSSRPSATPATPTPDLAEERRRLKTKIDELQRIIGEGQEERRELRRQLSDREDDAPAASSPSKGTSAESDLEDHADADPVDAPRAILVPHYSDRAAKVVTELAADAADGVLTVVASLAAGKPNAWGGVKQLTKARGVLSARAGIHHRVLFAMRDRTLEVLDVLHRKDLEQAVTRLSK